VSQVIAAINWVIEANASGEYNIRVINLAFGTDSMQDYRIDPLSYAVERAWHAGIVVVVAGGNDGLQAGQLKNPASNPFVIAVGAATYLSDTEMAVADYSSGGNMERGIDILAPGRRIVGPRNPGSFSDQFIGEGSGNPQYVVGSGTSQAAAVVTGAVALLLEQRPELTPDQVKWILMRSAEEARNEDGSVAGEGFLDLKEAAKTGTPKPQDCVQTHERSTGTGSLHAARGSVRVVIDGVPLEGEIDIFGNSWSGNSWSLSSWSGNSWSGNSWSGNSWSDFSWSGNSWSGNSWSGNSWSGNSWSGNSWSGNSWSGNSWSGNSWSGNSWSGNSWTGNSWTAGHWS
jgi:serine protease AprX